MGKKLRVGVLFGGKSAEHEISLLSARNVVESIDREKYDVVLIGVDKTGQWHLSDGACLLQGVSSAPGIQTRRCRSRAERSTAAASPRCSIQQLRDKGIAAARG